MALQPFMPYKNNETRKRYYKWYYANKVKPFREKKAHRPIMRYTCPMCGLSSSPQRFERKHHNLLRLVFFNKGYPQWKTIEQLTNDKPTQNIFYGKLQDFTKHIMQKCLQLLWYGIQWDLISKEEIISFLDLKVIQKFTEPSIFEELITFTRPKKLSKLLTIKPIQKLKPIPTLSR